MRIVRTKKDLLKALNEAQLKGEKIAFVPTMGNLHNGHLFLVQKAFTKASFVVVSIFINKKQFGKNEDFASYPRTEELDLQSLQQVKANLVYIPFGEEEVFGNQFNLTLDMPSLTNCLCGISRPNFFGGILAVLTRLFLQIKPHYVAFGKKDCQQLLIVRSLIKSLDLQIEVIEGETVREEGGLALSSRNVYLDDINRKKANFIFKILTKAKALIMEGGEICKILEDAKSNLIKEGLDKVEYLEIRLVDNLSIVKSFASENKSVLFFAGLFCGVRLIDNVELF